MAATTYTYSIAGDTANGKLDPDSLIASVRASAILVALSHAATDGDALKIVFKAAISSEEQTLLNGIVADHTGVSVVQSSVIKQVPAFPQGSGFRARTKCFTEMSGDFELAVSAGKKVQMLTSKVTFDSSLLSMPHTVFEILLNIGGTWFIVDQNFYHDLADLVVDADRVTIQERGESNVYRLDFDWPSLDSPNREPTILSSSMKIRIRLTDDAEHSGIGEGGSYLYYIHPVYGIKVYNPYTQSTNLPTWPDPAPPVKLAHVCLHCISFGESEV